MIDDLHVTVLLHQWDILNPAFSPESLRKSGVNHITLPIMWSRVEQDCNEFNFKYYDDIIFKLISFGFRLILMLDAGGRFEFDDNGNLMGGNTVIPHYVRVQHHLYSRDFYGDTTSQLSMCSEEAIDLIEKFFDRSVAHFSSRFGEHIFAFAIGIQGELEIKYAQSGYKWQDYSDAAKNSFRKHSGYEIPVIDYGRELKANPSPCLTYSQWIRFRESKLVECVRRLSHIIHSYNHLVMGYFGEFFTSHDGIMGLSVIGELGSILDAAAVDYNFYDGWNKEADPWKLVMLCSFARGIGFKQVFAGYYVERWRKPVGEPGSEVDKAIFPVIAQSIFECRYRNLIDGIEVGGFGNMGRDLASLRTPMMCAAIAPINGVRKTEGLRRVGVFGSHATFEWFVGEHSDGRNIHRDALSQTFMLLCETEDFLPVVISEKTFLHAPATIQQLQAIYVAHQPVLTDYAIEQLAQFARTGILVQDVRAGEWDENGVFRGMWMNDTFSIAGIGWENGGSFTFQDEDIEISTTEEGGASHALLVASQGAEVLVKSSTSSAAGLILRGAQSIALGFVPVFLHGASGDRLRAIFLDTLRASIDGYSLEAR